jgi:hypothetical protein
MFEYPNLTAKHGRLRVLIIARISTVNQDARSLLAQIELCKKWVRDRFPHDLEFVVIQSQGSGERLDREELAQAEEYVESGTFDVVIAEDLGRIMRRSRAVDFCELCEDYDTRLIAINDGIDTNEKKWRRNALFAAMKHEESNEDTSDRIKRQMDHNFSANGGCVNHIVWGIVKPPGCKGDAELSWDHKARKLIRAAIWKIEKQGQNLTEAARWLRQHGADGMTCKKLGRLVRDPILTGYRRRGMRRTRRLNKTGARRAVPAPEIQVLRRFCPNLQIISPARFERVNRLLEERNAKYKVGADGIDPRKGRPKRRTTWPGAHLVCGICGRFFCWGAHGLTGHLSCAGVKDYCCWNTTSVNGKRAADRLADAIIGEVMALSDFDDVFLQELKQQSDCARSDRQKQQRALEERIQKLRDQIDRLTDSIAENEGSSKGLNSALKKRENELAEVEQALVILNRTPLRVAELPPLHSLKEKAKVAFGRLLADTSEVPALVRYLCPEIYIVPFRLIDGGHVVLRAVFDLHLAALVVDPRSDPTLDRMLVRRVIVDLFDKPQREAIRTRVMAALQRDPRPTLKQIATELNVTETAVQHAVALQKQMTAAGIDDPYLRVTEPPADYNRQRMHRHPDYVFRPLPNFVAIA